MVTGRVYPPSAEDPTGPIGDAGSKEPSETILAVPRIILSARSIQFLSRRRYLPKIIVGSLMAVSNPSDKFSQYESSSKSDKTSIGGNILNCRAWTSILKLLATDLTDIGTTKFIGQVSPGSPK